MLIDNNGDTLITITPTQLLVTDLIFAEHEKLLITDSVKSVQINNYEELITNYQKSDSLYQEEISVFNDKINEDYKMLVDLEKKLDKTKKFSRFKNYLIGALSVLVILTSKIF